MVQELGVGKRRFGDGSSRKSFQGCQGRRGKKTLLVSAVLHQTGVTLNQVKVEPKGNEVSAVEPLLEGVEIRG